MLSNSLTETVTQAVAAGEKAVAVDTAMIAKLTDMAGDFAINLSIAMLILVATVFAAKWASRATRTALGAGQRLPP